MRRAARWLIVLGVLAAAAVFAWRLSRPEPILVVLAPVERGEVESTVSNTRVGTVEACRRAQLAPATGGQVAALPVHEGDRVGKGDLLLEIWNDDLKAELTLAQSEVTTAEARVREACLKAEVAEREAQRLQRLRERDLVSEERVDRATTDAKAQQAGCAAARAAHQVSRARVAVARAALERTVLKAPFAGVVAEVNAELGEYVTPSPPGIPTLPAVDLIDDSCLYVKAPIDEVDAPRIQPGMSACVSLDAFPGRLCNERVRRIAPYVLDREKQARTVDVEVDVKGARDGWNLLPGYSADVEIVLERREHALRVPTEAVLEGNRVLVYRAADARLEERTIETGLSNWRYTEVLSGLQAGERVVVSVAREGVVPGALVVPAEEAGDSSRP
jgi:HlyD family secretion protein